MPIDEFGTPREDHLYAVFDRRSRRRRPCATSRAWVCRGTACGGRTPRALREPADAGEGLGLMAMIRRVLHGGRPYLGVAALLQVTPYVAAQHNLPVDNGVLIGAVQRGGPAAKAGVRPGDIITALNGRATQSLEAFTDALAAHLRWRNGCPWPWPRRRASAPSP